MASRDLSAAYKTPKYFSSLSNLAKSLPRPQPLRDENSDLAPLSASKKPPQVPLYHTFKSTSPKSTKNPTAQSVYLSDTPKLKPPNFRPNPHISPKSMISSSSPDLTKSRPELDSAVVISQAPKQRLRTQYAGPRPIFCQRAASISATPSEFPAFRPATASNCALSVQPTPKSRTPREFLSPLGKSAEKLASLVTQVKPLPSENVPVVASRSDEIYREHLYQTFLAIKFVKALPRADDLQLISKKVILPRRKGYENKKTLIFDLDETLVHCVEEDKSRFADVILPISFPTGEVLKVIFT